MKSEVRRVKYACRTWVSGRLLPLATLQARWRLNKRAPLRILIDSSVLGHGVTHETAWLSTGVTKWVGQIDVDTGYIARIPVHAPNNDGRVYQEVRYLAPIAHLYNTSHIRLLTSAELLAEQYRQPMGRFRGYGWADHSVFAGMRFDSVDGLHFDFADPIGRQRSRIASCKDPLFQSLLSTLGDESSQDAWHIYTAEKHGLFAFLHVDFPLAEKIRQNKSPLCNLKTRVLLPSQLGSLFKILPLHTYLLGYGDDKCFPTRNDLYMPAQRRLRPKSRKE